MPRGDFRVVTHPDQQPAADFITGSSEGPFIDTGVDVIVRPNQNAAFRRERVYIAQATIENFAQLLGFEGTAGVNERQAEGYKAQGKIDFLNERLGDDVARLAGALTRILADRDSDLDHLDGN